MVSLILVLQVKKKGATLATSLHKANLQSNNTEVEGKQPFLSSFFFTFHVGCRRDVCFSRLASCISTGFLRLPLHKTLQVTPASVLRPNHCCAQAATKRKMYLVKFVQGQPTCSSLSYTPIQPMLNPKNI